MPWGRQKKSPNLFCKYHLTYIYFKHVATGWGTRSSAVTTCFIFKINM
nr:MAG TPA: hypothetical protein [Caudoviricetes sp.]